MGQGLCSNTQVWVRVGLKLLKMITYVAEKLRNMKMTNQLAMVLLVVDVLLSILIVAKVSYTEIDWKAYMEEVEGFLGGERDYTQIRGNTGPLVYPAGFLYIFAFFRMVTDNGLNILAAQFIFGLVYIANLEMVLRLYMKDKHLPFIAFIPLILSKRIHSIYMLRLFNDCIAAAMGYGAILSFVMGKWQIGCFIYSIGVSVKMNMLLYAPGILLLLLTYLGYFETFICLSICAIVQLVLGFPFLSTYPVEYLSKAFELSRVFMYKWTVNFKFLPEDVFLSKTLSIALLLCTIAGYVLFAWKWNRSRIQQSKSLVKTVAKASQISTPNPVYIMYTIFVSNFIGVAFARTLHYQFYCWYFHMLPYLLFHGIHNTGKENVDDETKNDQLKREGKETTGNSALSFLGTCVAGYAVLIAVEVAFNVYPGTWWSSLLLQASHAFVLIKVFASSVPAVHCPGSVSVKSE